MFGKRLSEYLRFQKVVLAVMAVVGLLRLALSLAGLPDATVTWVSMSAVSLAGAVYYGVAAYRTGFGGYRHLLPLVLAQVVLANLIAVAGILLTLAGARNIYGAPEYSGPFFAQSQWRHLLGHLTIGMVFPTLVLWALASLAMLATRALAPRAAQRL